MISYLDSSFLVSAYLVDEPEHERARALVSHPTDAVITGSWSRLEVSGALVRAARAHRGDEKGLLALFDRDTHPSHGTLTLIDANQAEIESVSISIVRRSGIRAMDAWHLACAMLAFDELAEPGEVRIFVTRDAEQASAARDLGLTVG